MLFSTITTGIVRMLGLKIIYFQCGKLKIPSCYLALVYYDWYCENIQVENNFISSLGN